MQYLKEEVRNTILENAKNEFYEAGFRDANMRSIATKANITVGNIYRYFPGKTELFSAIIDPVLEKIRKLVILEPMISFEDIRNVKVVNKFIHTGVRICADYTKEIVIILSKSQGTKYENGYDYLKALIANSVSKSFALANDALAEAISVSLISGLLHILRENHDDQERIISLASDLIYYIFSGNIKGDE